MNSWFVPLQGIPVAPTFYPTPEEFTDPLAYIEKIKPEGEKYACSPFTCWLSYHISIVRPCKCTLMVAAATMLLSARHSAVKQIPTVVAAPHYASLTNCCRVLDKCNITKVAWHVCD